MGIPLPNDVRESLGLGQHFSITNITFTWAKLDVMTTEGPKTFHVLIMEDETGRHGYVFNHDDAQAFLRSTTHATTGLVIPTKGIISNDN